jgi:hypothetical protein
LHPEGGWQTFTPVTPYGPQESEQHLLSQPRPVQTVPVGAQGWLPITSQRPSVSLPCLVQVPPQHSKSFAQTSPVCVQNDTFTHLPFAPHCFEQH